MPHNNFLEIHGTNRIALQGLLKIVSELQLNLYKEQALLEKESETYLKDWENLQYKSALLELVKLNIKQAIRGLDSGKEQNNLLKK